MKTQEYLAACKEKLNITTDYKLAKALGVQQSLVTKYLRGQVVPGPLVAYRVAEILGDQPFAVMADFEAERAEKMGKADDVQEWQGIIKKIAGGAMGILLAVGMGFSPNADAQLRSAPTLTKRHIVFPDKGKRRRRRSSKAAQLAAA